MSLDELLTIFSEYSLPGIAIFILTILLNYQKILEAIDYKKSAKLRHLEKMLSIEGVNEDIRELCEKERQYEIFRLMYKIKPRGDLINRICYVYNKSKGQLRIETLIYAISYIKEHKEKDIKIIIKPWEHFVFMWNASVAVVALVGSAVLFMMPLVLGPVDTKTIALTYGTSAFSFLGFLILLWQTQGIVSAKAIKKCLDEEENKDASDNQESPVRA